VPDNVNDHYLFVSGRSNHMGRMLSLLKGKSTSSEWVAWCANNEAYDTVSAHFPKRAIKIRGEWTKFIKLKHLYDAYSWSRKCKQLFSDELDRVQVGSVCLYLVKYFAWVEFWSSNISKETTSVVVTFEKSDVAKSMLSAAKDKGVPHRVHWVHGLRHASLQSTFSTELWCMTPGDVRFFSPRVPDFCKPVLKSNPEAIDLIDRVGVVNPSTFSDISTLHFLFLGPGLEASYPREMRMADMEVIRKAQEEFGARIRWRFRPHPAAIERFESELKDAGINAEYFSTGDLDADLRWSHIIGSSWSSLLLDIRETGRPILWVQAELRDLGAVDELVADGIGTHVDTETVIPVLDDLLGC